MTKSNGSVHAPIATAAGYPQWRRRAEAEWYLTEHGFTWKIQEVRPKAVTSSNQVRVEETKLNEDWVFKIGKSFEVGLPIPLPVYDKHLNIVDGCHTTQAAITAGVPITAYVIQEDIDPQVWPAIAICLNDLKGRATSDIDRRQGANTLRLQGRAADDVAKALQLPRARVDRWYRIDKAKDRAKALRLNLKGVSDEVYNRLAAQRYDATFAAALKLIDEARFSTSDVTALTRALADCRSAEAELVCINDLAQKVQARRILGRPKLQEPRSSAAHKVIAFLLKGSAEDYVYGLDEEQRKVMHRDWESLAARSEEVLAAFKRV